MKTFYFGEQFTMVITNEKIDLLAQGEHEQGGGLWYMLIKLYR